MDRDFIQKDYEALTISAAAMHRVVCNGFADLMDMGAPIYSSISTGDHCDNGEGGCQTCDELGQWLVHAAQIVASWRSLRVTLTIRDEAQEALDEFEDEDEPAPPNDLSSAEKQALNAMIRRLQHGSQELN